MAQKITRGKQTYTEQPIQIESSHRNGGTTTRTFISPNPNNDPAPAEMINLYNTLFFEGYDCKMTGGTNWTLVATLAYDVQTNPGQSMPDPIWEIDGKPFEAALLTADIAIVNTLSTRTKTLIEARLKKPDSTQPLTDPSEVSQLANATKVYNLMRRGEDSKKLFQPIVKRTITVSNTFSNLTWTLNNVGNIVSSTVLINNFGVPARYQGLIPPSNTTTSTDGITFFTGFLVYQPNVVDVGSNRTQISQEFEYGKWAVDTNTIIS